MKKYTLLAVVALLISTTIHGATAVAPMYGGTITIGSGTMTNTTGEFLLGSENELDIGARELDSFSGYNAAGTNTAVFYLIMTDGGFDTVIGTTSSLGAGTGEVIYPARTVADGVTAGYVVTNYPVFYEAGGAVLTTTGDVVVAIGATTNAYTRSVIANTTTSTSKYTPYYVRRAKVRVVQSATLGAGTYTWTLKTK